MKDIFRTHRTAILVSSAVILLPLLAGLLLWNALPETVPIHWDASGAVDGYASRTVAVFGMPLFFFVLHVICITATFSDQRNDNQSPRALSIVFWILPIVSLAVGGLIYTTALGYPISGTALFPVVLGLMFLFFGNYFPKLRRNRTLGIRIPWTLHSEENWNRTHRTAGRLWVVGGIVMLLSALLPWETMMTVVAVVLLILTVFPFVYSYRIYRAEVGANTVPPLLATESKGQRAVRIFGVLLIGLLVVLVVVSVVIFIFSSK